MVGFINRIDACGLNAAVRRVGVTGLIDLEFEALDRLGCGLRSRLGAAHEQTSGGALLVFLLCVFIACHGLGCVVFGLRVERMLLDFGVALLAVEQGFFLQAQVPGPAVVANHACCCNRLECIILNHVLVRCLEIELKPFLVVH